MKKYSEVWNDAYAGEIPFQHYMTTLTNGDDGLTIQLEGEQYKVILDFGLVCAIRMVDEGVELNWPEGFEPSDSYLLARANRFSSTLYIIENGQFASEIHNIYGDLFQVRKLKEYRIVALNYVISVITEYEPEISVSNL